MKRPLLLLTMATTVVLGLGLLWPQGGDPPAAAGSRSEPAPSGPTGREPPSAPTRALVAAPQPEDPPADAAGELVGRIVDALGQPLPDCDVAFLEMPEERPFTPAPPTPAVASARSEPNGRFRLAVASREPGVVTLRHRDFPPHVAAHGVEVAAGATVDLGEITLFSQPGLRVQVRTPSGAPIAEALATAAPALQDVSLPTAIHALRERSGLTDEGGQAILYGVLAGPYVVRVEAPSFATQEFNHLQPDNPPEAPRLEVSLQPGHVIRGRVLAQDGGDLGRVFLSAVPAAGGITLRDQMRANGDFRITGAAPGRYRVCADSTTLGPTTVEVEVPTNTPLTITLGSGLKLRGVVRDDGTGAPVVGARVLAEPADGWPLIRAGRTVHTSAITDGNGEFEISGLPPGRFTVTATSEWFVPTHLELVDAGSAPLELRLEPGLVLTGRVRRNAAPVAGAKVRAISWSSDSAAMALWRASLTTDFGERSATTDAEGRFTLAGVATDGQRLVVSADGCALWFSELLRGGKGQSLDLGVVELRPGAGIVGTAPADATVCLQARSPRALSLTASADARGRFAFRGLPAGEYELFYHSAGAPRAGATAPSLSDRVPVTLEEGEQKTITLKH